MVNKVRGNSTPLYYQLVIPLAYRDICGCEGGQFMLLLHCQRSHIVSYISFRTTYRSSLLNQKVVSIGKCLSATLHETSWVCVRKWYIKSEENVCYRMKRMQGRLAVLW